MKEIDQMTIEKASKGSDKAFKQIYSFYAPFLWKVSYHSAKGDENSAAEILQNTFIKVYKSLGSYKFKAGFSTWLYRIALNETYTFYKKVKRTNSRESEINEDTVSGNKDPEQELQDKRIFRKILNSLSPDDRFLITSKEISGLKFNELSEIFNTSEGSLRTRLSRIKERIRKEYENVL